MSDQPQRPGWEQGSDGKWYQPGSLAAAGWWQASDGRWYPPPRATTQRSPAPSVDVSRGGLTPRTTRCPEGHPAAAGSAFCKDCGRPIKAAPPSPAPGVEPSLERIDLSDLSGWDDTLRQAWRATS